MRDKKIMRIRAEIHEIESRETLPVERPKSLMSDLQEGLSLQIPTATKGVIMKYYK